MNKKDRVGFLITLGACAIAIVLVIGSLGWLITNLDEFFGIFSSDPEPTVVAPTEVVVRSDAVDAALLAECQEQLEHAILDIGFGPTASDDQKEWNADYLHKAEVAQAKLRDLVIMGIVKYDAVADGDVPAKWHDWAIQYRVDLRDAVDEVKYIGMDDVFVRIGSELFVAYHYIDIFSDTALDGTLDVGPLRQAELHLDTARRLLNR